MSKIAAIAISGDVTAGQAYVPRARHMLHRLAQVMFAAESPARVQRTFERFDDHAYGYAIAHNGQYRAVIVVDSDPAQDPDTPTVTPEVPDFWSGAVLGGTTTNGRMHDFWPTSKCSDLYGLPSAPFPTRRLAVEPHGSLSDVLSGPDYTQYVGLKPTMYSGKMRKVVQLLMGFGRIGQSIYDAPPRLGPRTEERPALTRYEQDVVNNGLQIRYDWRVFRTHGIYTSADGTLWLIEIGRVRGVLAMPLPMNAVSQMPAFRDKLEALGDTAGIFAIDELGGYPTGEMFPVTTIESAIRAGEVLRLISVEDMDPFYSKVPYGSSMGWAFNNSGTEAHNTCWTHMPDGVQTGFHYGVHMTIGSITESDPSEGAARIKSRIARFVDKPDFRERYSLMTRKADRLTQEQASSLLRSVTSDVELFEQLDLFQLQPMASGSASLVLESSGRLFHLGEKQPHIKFPEPDLGYLVSHDMRPILPLSSAFIEECNTVMHAFFSMDQLKYVKYFRPAPSSIPEITESNMEECMYVGVYSSRTEAAGKIVPDMMFTDEFDDREEIALSYTETKITGSLVGYTSVSCSDNPVNLSLAFCQRVRTFKRKTETYLVAGQILRSAVIVPFHDRESYLYVLARGASESQDSTQWSYINLNDPWGCPTWRNFPGFTGNFPSWCGAPQAPDPELFPGCWTLGLHPNGCGPVLPRTAMEPSPSYSPAQCSDFADTGPWCFLCDNVDAMSYSVSLPPLPAPLQITKINEVRRSVWIVSSMTDRPGVVVEDLSSSSNAGDYAVYENPWFIPSPDPVSGNTQYTEATGNALGLSVVQRYWAKPNDEMSVVVTGAPTHPLMDDRSTTWIGVV